MKKFFRIIIALLLAALLLGSLAWYLLSYDRAFTRDMLLRQARINDMRGNTSVSAWFYRLAYAHSGNDEDVATELANQYLLAGNYTKAEVTLSNAIKSRATADLYTALCKTFVQQDKLLDAVALLNGISDPAIREEIEQRRPPAPIPEQTPGFYNNYISVDLTSPDGRVYYTTNGEYPSVNEAAFSEPVTLPAGETVIYAISVNDSGLVSQLSVLGYTVGGVVESAVFTDLEMEYAVRDQLGVGYESPLYTNDLWGITEFTVPNNAGSLADLALLPHLQTLNIQNMQLTTLQDLSKVTELTALDLSGSRFPLEELAVLQKLPALKKLVIADCGISTLADIAGLNGLTYLDLSNNTVRNLEPITGMENMRELYMQHNALTSLEALTLMYNLDKLDVSYNALSDLTPLSACQQLTWLNASNNQIADVNGISVLPGLTTLSLNYNQLYNVTPLGNCVTLKELGISNNHIGEISALSTLMNLEVFDFSYNQIVSLPIWGTGGALRIIQGSYNQLNGVSPLSGMYNLTYVSLDYNQLTDISAMASCTNLVQVNVFGNPISDVTALTDHNIIVNYDPT